MYHPHVNVQAVQRSTKLIFGSILGGLFLLFGIGALAVGTLTSSPDFTQLRSSVEVTYPLPNDKKFTRRVGPATSDWVGMSQISNHLLMAVIASEDTAFFSHDGVDYHELKESVRKDLKEKRWARGASTITQQLIKNVYLSRQKNLWRKFKEILWARELDKVLSKSETLAFYVNLVEWGPGIYGIRQAAHHYFKCTPAILSARQAAFLAMLLPAPVKYYSYFKKRELSDFANRRVAQILRVMNRMGFLEDGEFQIALHESLWGETVPFADPNLPVPSDLSEGEDLPVPPSQTEPAFTSPESVTPADTAIIKEDPVSPEEPVGGVKEETP